MTLVKIFESSGLDHAKKAKDTLLNLETSTIKEVL